ncbi:MAG: hypothetical protein WA981_08150 [Glaciecola sp.]
MKPKKTQSRLKTICLAILLVVGTCMAVAATQISLDSPATLPSDI